MGDVPWAVQTLDSLVSSIHTEATEVLGCSDCDDTGFYGLTAAGNDDLLVALVKRAGEGEFELLSESGIWEPYLSGPDTEMELISLEIAEDLASALTAGASGLLRKYCMPMAFLPSAEVVTASALTDLLGSKNTSTPRGKWVNFAIVDDDDAGAVMQVVRADGDDSMQVYQDGSWEPWQPMDGRLLAVELDDDVLQSVLTAAGFPKHQKCKYCKNHATKRILHSEGMAYIPVCDDHLDKGKQDAAASVPSGNPDPSNINSVQDITAAGALVADAPLIVSPNPKAEKLRRYWSTGTGDAKIRWMTPGDWKRCYAHLVKYMGAQAKGYCQNLHKRNDGVWTGSKFNPGGNGRGHGFRASASIEDDLVASVQSGSWSGESERNSDMPETELKDGVYGEVEDSDAGVFRTLIAGGFPVAPPKSWFDDPKLTGPTPMEIGDDGRVFGHIATWDATHIGMGGSVKPPKSASNYAYYRTGILATAEGEKVNVGQITLAGGHAPMHASAAEAVKHYDDTKSAVADVAAGEDIYGIWVAGSLRPDVTASQIRTFRASPPSGDWRMISGNLELVAACSVNVPGFMNVRTQALAAGGAILALVAAGSRPLAERRMSMLADAAVLDRITQLEERIAAIPVVVSEPEPAVVSEPEPVAVVEEPAVATEAVAATAVVAEPPTVEENVADATAAATESHPDEVQPEPADKLDPEEVARARADAKAIRRDWLRREAHGGVTAGNLPPQFAKNAAKNSAKKIPETERKGGGYPIKDAASLKDAIQAVGRAKPEDRAKTIAHIKSAAAKLGLTKLLPSTPGW
jgi:hypothetical protein